MMKLKLQKMDLNLLLLLVSAILLFNSCESKVKKKNDFNVNDNIVEIVKPKEIQNKFEYNNEDVIKTLALNFNSKELLILFLLDQEGRFGDSNFEKYIDIVLLENGILIDKIEFSNQSILCDLELIQESVKVIKLVSNEKLFFIILESCDGEDPDVLRIVTWDGNKQNYEIEIPKYFESQLDKDELLKKLSAKFDESINENILETVRRLIDYR